MVHYFSYPYQVKINATEILTLIPSFQSFLGRDTKYFHPDYLALLTPGDGNVHSKKELDIKRKELASAVQEPLCQVSALKQFHTCFL